jgi:hypothetical protein
MLIEVHRMTYANLNAVLHAKSKIQEAYRTLDGRLPKDGEYLELMALETQIKKAHRAETKATETLLSTSPATLGGALALLRYLDSHNDDILCADVGDKYGYYALVSTLIPTLEAAHAAQISAIS